MAATLNKIFQVPHDFGYAAIPPGLLFKLDSGILTSRKVIVTAHCYMCSWKGEYIVKMKSYSVDYRFTLHTLFHSKITIFELRKSVDL
jgi:hypothetical protein